MQPSKRQASLGAEKYTVVNHGGNRPLGSDPQAGRILDLSFPQRERRAVVNGVADVVLIAKNVIHHSPRPRSPKMIGNTVAIEPPRDLAFRPSVLDILAE